MTCGFTCILIFIQWNERRGQQGHREKFGQELALLLDLASNRSNPQTIDSEGVNVVVFSKYPTEDIFVQSRCVLISLHSLFR